MNKILLLCLILIIILVGCENRNNDSLDTSELKKIEQPHLTKEQRKIIPIRYGSSSLKEGLSALPFKIKIPKKFPFKVEPIESLVIDDIDHNGGKLNVQYDLSHFDKSKLFVVVVSIHNYNPELNYVLDTAKSDEIVILKGGVRGSYTGHSSLGVSNRLNETKESEDLIENTLIFEKAGMYYELTYVANFATSEKIKQYVINIANQML